VSEQFVNGTSAHTLGYLVPYYSMVDLHKKGNIIKAI